MQDIYTIRIFILCLRMLVKEVGMEATGYILSPLEITLIHLLHEDNFQHQYETEMQPTSISIHPNANLHNLWSAIVQTTTTTKLKLLKDI